MSFIVKHNSKNALWLAVWVCAIVACSAPAEAQQTAIAESTEFEFSGRVTAKSDFGFEVKTKDGEVIKVSVSETTDFAMRLASPWFSGQHRMVAVDGKVQPDGKRERISYSLPKGQLYLLVQFRNPAQRDRILKQPTWRLNNYLISDQPIDSFLPADKELLLAGKLDLENSSLIIGEKSWPITLGHRRATLRGRSFADIVADDTVVLVTGSNSGGVKSADTVLFMTR